MNADAAADGGPFVGLTPFTEEQADYFFGRDTDRAVLASNLIAARLMVLYGPSGCGKSSLLDAGVAHQVNREQAPRRIAARGAPEFAVVMFRAWRDDPVAGLLAAVRATVERVLGRPVEPPTPGLGLADALDAWADRLGGTLLLVLDQFEEYFLYHGRSVAEGTFAQALAEAVTRPGLRVNVLISLREDALARLDAFEGLIPNLLGNTLRLDPLDRDRAREAIEGPIARFRDRLGPTGGPVEVEPPLTRAVLANVRADAIELDTDGRGRLVAAGDEEDERPIEAAYLQLVMARLWHEEKRLRSATIRRETFQRLGGAEGIVRSHLDVVLRRLGHRGRRIAERLLTYLVTPSGTKIALDPGYLAEKTGIPARRVTATLDRLAEPDCRVVRRIDAPGGAGTSFEIYHDVLARVIVDDYAPRVRRRRLQYSVAGLVAGLMLALGLVALAGWQAIRARAETRRAEEQTRIATSRQLAALAEAELGRRLDRALLLGVEARRAFDTFEARSLLFRALTARPGLDAFLDCAEGSITSVAFSPDGRTLAAGYYGGGAGGVVLFDAAGRRRLVEAPMPVAEGDVVSLAFSPDGRTLAAGYVGGGAGGVVLFDPDARRRLAEAPLAVAEGYVRSVAFRPDGRALAVGYGGGAGGVVLFDPAGRRRLAERPLEIAEGRVNGVAYSPDGRTLAAGYVSAGGGGGVALFDPAGGRRALEVAEGGVMSVAFSPDGRTLAAGYEGRVGRTEAASGGVVLFDAAGRRRVEKPLPVAEGYVRCVAFSPDGRSLAAGYFVGDSGGVVLFDPAGRRRAGAPLGLAEGRANGVVFRPDGRSLAVGYGSAGGGGVALFDPAGGRRALEVAEGGVNGLAFSRDGRTLAAGYGGGGDGGGVVLFDVAGRRRLAEAPLAVAEGGVSSVAFSQDRRTLAAGYGGGDGGGVVLFDVAGRRLAEKALPVAEGYVSSVAFSPDGRTLAAGYGGGGGGVVLFDVAGRRRLAEAPLAVAEGGVNDVAFRRDGRALAAGYGGIAGGVALFDPAGRARLTEAPLAVAEGGVNGVAFGPDGQLLAAGCGIVGGSGGVALFDVTGRRWLAEYPASVAEGNVTSIAFSPDTRALAAGYVGGDGGGVVLFDVAGRRRLAEAPLAIAEGGVNDVAFSPDGRTLAAGYVVGGVVLWDVVPADAQIRRACRIANRNLSLPEWRDYFGPDVPYRRTCPELPDGAGVDRARGAGAASR